MGVSTSECVVCAWRATCNLKFIYEGGSSLHCPEFTRDVLMDIGTANAKPTGDNGATSIPEDNLKSTDKKVLPKDNTASNK